MNNDEILQTLIGETITKVEGFSKYDEEMILTFKNGLVVKFHHEQDCCENVAIENIDGDFDDLLNVPLIMCEESTSENESNYGTQTWTFYKFATVKGYVTLRWLGESNGYYSESVDIDLTYEEDNPC